MGLEGVELVMEIEDEFKITIPDAEAGIMKTIGDVARFVTSKRCSRWPRQLCPTAHRFYKFRRVLIESFDFQRAKVRPSTTLTSIMPWQQRRRMLSILKKAGFWMPELIVPKKIQLTFAMLALIGCAIYGWRGDIALAFLAALFAVPIAVWLAEAFAYRFPEGYVTIGDFIRHTTFTTIPEDEIDPDVLNRICQITAELISVPREGLSAQTRFNEDLNF